MAFHIRDEATDTLARKLARRTGKGLTETVRLALEAELRRRDDDLEHIARSVTGNIQPGYMGHLLLVVHCAALGCIRIATQAPCQVSRLVPAGVEKDSSPAQAGA